MHRTHSGLGTAVRREARLARRSILQFAFPINPQFRRGLIGALSVSVLLVWGAWVPARSHGAPVRDEAPAHVQAPR